MSRSSVAAVACECLLAITTLLPVVAAAAGQMAMTATAAWQGDWTVTRVDPRLRTRAGAELLSLHVDTGPDGALAVDWAAGRAICPQPLEAPCEWVGAHGQQAIAMQSGDSLLAVLPVSADEADPLVLHLHRSPGAALAAGVLLGARGELRYRVEAQPEPRR